MSTSFQLPDVGAARSIRHSGLRAAVRSNDPVIIHEHNAVKGRNEFGELLQKSPIYRCHCPNRFCKKDILSYGKYLGINFDIGHFVAGTSESPIPLLRKYHDRILSLHLKDRKVNNGPNMPFGEGDTPVALVLQLMKREGWKFPADIELEYKVPEGSDAVAEVTKCVQFCRESLG